MPVPNIIERLGRAIFEAPFGSEKISKEAPELAEIRLAILDAVKAKTHRAGGKIVFPYNYVRVNLVGVPDEQAPIFRSSFLASYFADELRTGLTRSGYRFPDDLGVEISTTAQLPAAGHPWLTVDTELREAKVEQHATALALPADLTVINGKAEPATLKLDKPNSNIGRTPVVHQAGGPSRLNDLAFSEEDAVSRSVSRQHAHIQHNAKTGEYRLFNDRVYKGPTNCGLYLVRDGASQPIHRGSHGAVLLHGDEIHLGQAILRFEAK